jgi:hypothetical protein
VAEDREDVQSTVVVGKNFGVWQIWEYFEIRLVLRLLCSSLLSLLIVF